jgi:hypothetical protein
VTGGHQATPQQETEVPEVSSNRILTPIWSAEDTQEVFERAATVKAMEAAGMSPVIELGEVIA